MSRTIRSFPLFSTSSQTWRSNNKDRLAPGWGTRSMFRKSRYLIPGWKQDRTLSNNNRLVFRNETANAVLEVKEIPSDGHSAKLIAQALANKANCFKLENIGSSYIITCDQIDTFTRVTVKDQTAEISTITCHEQTTCDAAVKILKNIDL